LAQGLDTDKINPYIEKCFGIKKPLITVLRLLCAQCLTNNGFKPKMLEFYCREILQVGVVRCLVALNVSVCETATFFDPHSLAMSLSNIMFAVSVLLSHVVQ
ncbi:hypothetical protein ACROYT_G010338, partial [Oculina patagonica]